MLGHLFLLFISKLFSVYVCQVKLTMAACSLCCTDELYLLLLYMGILVTLVTILVFICVLASLVLCIHAHNE